MFIVRRGVYLKRIVLAIFLILFSYSVFAVNCTIQDSTLINSSAISNTKSCVVFNSTLLDSYLEDTNVFNSTINVSRIFNSYIYNSTLISTNQSYANIKDSFFCQDTQGYFAVINKNLLFSGQFVYQGYIFFAPQNISKICQNLKPKTGFIISNETILNNNASVKFIYEGITGQTVSLNLTTLDSNALTVQLNDSNDDGIYEADHTISENNTGGDGVKFLFARISDNLGNLFIINTSVVLDNTPPSGSVQINSGNATTIKREVFLTLNYSDSNGIYECRYSNNIFSDELFEPCTPIKSWLLPSAFGNETVFYQVKDFAGNLDTFNSTIEYISLPFQDTTPPLSPTIYDGLKKDDLNYSNLENEVSARWFGAIDYESSYILYDARLLSYKMEPKWNKTWGGLYRDELYTIKIDSNDNLFLGGTDTVSLSAPYDEIYFAKMDSDGNIAWAYVYHQGIDESITDIFIDEYSGFIYDALRIYGASGGNLWDFVFEKRNFSNGLYLDIYVDSEGFREMSDALLRDNNGNFYIVGYGEESSNGPQQYKIGKYRMGQAEIWDKEIGQIGSTEMAYSGCLDEQQQFYFTGFKSSNAHDLDVYKLNSSTGETIWQTNYTTSTLEEGREIFCQNNILYVVGIKENSGQNDTLFLKLNQSNGYLFWNRTMGSSANEIVESAKMKSGVLFLAASQMNQNNNWDFWLVGYNPEKNMLFLNYTWGNNETDDYAYGIDVDSKNNVYMVGYTYNSTSDKDLSIVKFGPSSSTNVVNISSAYNLDSFGYINLFTKTDFVFENLNMLTPGLKYTVEIKAKNPYNISSTGFSDGFIIDTEKPKIEFLNSSTHENENLTYSNSTAQFYWNAIDDYSIDGYSYLLDTNPLAEPDSIIDTYDLNVTLSNLVSGTYYFHLKALDKAGNYFTKHKKINVQWKGSFISLEQPITYTSSDSVNIMGFVSKNSSLFFYSNNVLKLNIAANQSFTANISLENGTNIIYAVSVSENYNTTSNIIKVEKLNQVGTNLSFDVTFLTATNTLSLSRLVYYDSGSFLLGLGSDSNIANPQSGATISITSNETAHAYIFLAEKTAPLPKDNLLLERNQFLDLVNPSFRKTYKGNFAGFFIKPFGIYTTGNFTLGPGRYELRFEHKGKTKSGLPIIHLSFD